VSTSPSTASSIGDRLADSPAHRTFREHPFFAAVDSAELTKEQAAVLLEQWWHPLHYFPTFLARTVSVLPDISAKSAITRILSQETGGGRSARSHEVIYADSMQQCGFDRDRITGTAPFTETAALLEVYRTGSETAEGALGCVFATETTDLLMVSSIGKAIERTTGVTDNAWVTIHVRQEPDHVEEANNALLTGLDQEQQDAVVAAADDMWRAWTTFFDRLVVEAGVRVDEVAAATR
jgi:pyrroloquinoline quinone (PQQ) biosynthesis protein C